MAASSVTPVVASLRVKLCVDLHAPRDLAPLRVSVRDTKKLSSQQETGIDVYSDNPDFTALQALGGNIGGPGWTELRYNDVHARGGSRRLGWTRQVGRTLFLAVPDSAAESNLPADPDDPAQIGRNAFATALVAIAIAIQAENIYVPFLSRMWRDNVTGAWIMKSIRAVLPGCRIWDGKELLRADSGGQLVTAVKGGTAANYVAEFKAQTFDGVVKILRRGEWARSERELPAGLRRKPKTGVGKESVVELDPKWWPIVVQAFEKWAAGDSYDQIGEFLAENDFPMRGTRGVGKTWNDYSTRSSRRSGTHHLLTDPDALTYYRTGRLPVRIYTAAPVEDGGSVRGVPVEYDQTERKHFWRGEVALVHQPVLTDTQWQKADKRLKSEAERRSRNGGGAGQVRDETAAFQGVTAWGSGDGRESKLAPETATAYRWRERDFQPRGWNNGEGDVVATLRRANFDRACGAAIIDALRTLSEPLAVLETREPHETLAAFEHRLEDIYGELTRAKHAMRRAEEELLQAEDEDDRVSWRSARQRKRDDISRLERDRDETLRNLENAREHSQRVVETETANITLPALVGSLMLDSSGSVQHNTAVGLRQLGVLSSLTLRFADAHTLPAHLRSDSERNVCAIERWVVARATLTVDLANGEKLDLPITWKALDSWAQPGNGNLTKQMIRLWAEGKSLSDIERLLAGTNQPMIEGRLLKCMRVAGLAGRYLPSVIVNCPIVAARSIIASRVLDDPTLVHGIEPSRVDHILNAYFEPGPTVKAWGDTPGLEDVRRILAVFARAERSIALDGLPTDSLARLTGVAPAEIRRLGRQRRPFDMPNHGTVRPYVCGHCNVPMTCYTPCPETAPTGVVCPKCTRTVGSDVPLGIEYLIRWRRTDAGYIESPEPVVSAPSVERDATLTVSELASRLGVPAHVVRAWDKAGDLVPHRRDAHGNRLYQRAQLKASERLAVAWREKNGAPEPNPELLTAPEVAALLGATPKQVRHWALLTPPLIPTAEISSAGRRRYRRADVELAQSRLSAHLEGQFLATIGDIAAMTGHLTSTIRDLTNRGVLACTIVSGRRRYDRTATLQVLTSLDLLGSDDNPVVAIGVLQESTGLSQTLLRRLSDEGHLPMTGRIGGKRRYRLRDALRAVDELYDRGILPHPQ